MFVDLWNEDTVQVYDNLFLDVFPDQKLKHI